MIGGKKEASKQDYIVLFSLEFTCLASWFIFRFAPYRAPDAVITAMKPDNMAPLDLGERDML